MKSFLVILSLIVIITCECEAQQILMNQTQDSVSQRKYFMILSFGFAEYMSFCFGYQINSSYSLGLKAQSIFLESSGGGGATGFTSGGASGIGLVGSYYFDGTSIRYF